MHGLLPTSILTYCRAIRNHFTITITQVFIDFRPKHVVFNVSVEIF
jgi:hypothetical protein